MFVYEMVTRVTYQNGAHLHFVCLPPECPPTCLEGIEKRQAEKGDRKMEQLDRLHEQREQVLRELRYTSSESRYQYLTTLYKNMENSIEGVTDAEVS